MDLSEGDNQAALQLQASQGSQARVCTHIHAHTPVHTLMRECANGSACKSDGQACPSRSLCAPLQSPETTLTTEHVDTPRPGRGCKEESPS